MEPPLKLIHYFPLTSSYKWKNYYWRPWHHQFNSINTGSSWQLHGSWVKIYAFLSSFLLLFEKDRPQGIHIPWHLSKTTKLEYLLKSTLQLTMTFLSNRDGASQTVPSPPFLSHYSCCDNYWIPTWFVTDNHHEAFRTDQEAHSPIWDLEYIDEWEKEVNS